ncbi:hypothetical protein WJX84_012067 [Apatococcus fuscideae]|uniref:Uncharacterized protein n=1 Tax=Apatococcus fuscideae TaxID=2026836 RepID=A0AAW1RHK5_9CHLO
MVDGFRFQNSRCQCHFLSHSHADHTTGLTKNFTGGLIYCSPVTAVLLRKDMGMPPERVVPLQLESPISIDGVTVTLIDANHCPGAVMFLFQIPARQGSPAQLILHTGDLRWHSGMAEHPALKGKPLDVLYLDTTYALPKHVHPPQDVAIAQIIDVMQKSYKEEPRTLFVVGAYHIGKERAFLGAAKALQWPVWVAPEKLRVLGMLDLPASDMALLTTREADARIHVVFMGQGLQPDALEKRMNSSGDWARVVAFRPTGWSYRKHGLETRRQGPVTIYGVPYSEHSSFPELRDCVKRLRPKRLIPTVNASNPTASRRVEDRFADLMDLSGDRSRLDMYFAAAQQSPTAADCGHACDLGSPDLELRSTKRRCLGHANSTLNHLEPPPAVQGGWKGPPNSLPVQERCAPIPNGLVPASPEWDQKPGSTGMEYPGLVLDPASLGTIHGVAGSQQQTTQSPPL